MATPQEELEALRAQVAALSARIYELEIRAGLKARVYQGLMPGEALPQKPAESQTPPAGKGTPVAAPPFPVPFSSVAPPRSRNREDLEGTIGRLWFNRVGIFALLFGVALFLKYAFDNN